MESRSGRARRDAEHLGDLHEGESDVVMQDEHGSLLDREVSESTFKLVAIGDC